MAASTVNQSSEIVLTVKNQHKSEDPPSGQPVDDEEEVVAAEPKPKKKNKSRMKEMEGFFRYDSERDKASDVRTAHLTVAVLMATATYQAGLSPPGGVWQEHKPEASPEEVAGVSVMGTKNTALFTIFMVGNTVGFFMSLYMIVFLTRGFPLRIELMVSMAALTATYCSSMYAIMPSSENLITIFYGLSVGLPISLPFIVRYLRDSKCVRKFRPDIKRNPERVTEPSLH